MRKILRDILSLYSKAMYWRWKHRNFHMASKLVGLMMSGWQKMKILDLGSGDGKIAGEREFRGVDITCVDADKWAVKECKKKGLRFRIFDIRDLDKEVKEGEFDIVWCLDVLEHLEKKEAIKILDYLEQAVNKQIIVFIPLGYFPQDIDNNQKSNKELKRHRSYWERNDFLKRGYKCKVLKGFHFDIRLYCSSLRDKEYPVVRDAMWAVKDIKKNI